MYYNNGRTLKRVANGKEMSGMNYEKEYSEESFWQKIKSVAKKAGSKTIYMALLLYYATRRPETPKWAKVTIYGALGYFISFIDAIPDITPLVGYSDDLGVLALALTTCAVYINDAVKASARAKLREWFGDEILEEIQEVEASLDDRERQDGQG